MVENSSVEDVVNVTKIFPYGNYNGAQSVNSSSYLIQELDLLSYILYSVSVSLMFISFCINGLVLYALRRTGSLRASFLIQGIIVADILVSLALGTQMFPYILLAFGCDPVLSISCYEGFSKTTTAILVIVQLYTGLAVSVDRLWSVLRPLAYHTTDYSKFKKIVILGSIWFGPLTLFASINITDLVKQLETDHRHICLVQRELPMMRGLLYGYITPSLAVVAIFSTLFLYLGILSIVIKQRTRRRRLTDTTNRVQHSNASLALTLFLVHLTYLLCYSPLIVLYIFFRKDLTVQGFPEFDINYFSLSSTIYQCNTVIDPLIFAGRIRSVRNYMWFVLRKRYHRREPRRTCTSEHRHTLSHIYTTSVSNM